MIVNWGFLTLTSRKGGVKASFWITRKPGSLRLVVCVPAGKHSTSDFLCCLEARLSSWPRGSPGRPMSCKRACESG